MRRADPYRQRHPVSDPPIEHLEVIVSNAHIFHARWGRWPMPGWFDALERSLVLTRRGGHNAATASGGEHHGR
jgi:hypothetical protein